MLIRTLDFRVSRSPLLRKWEDNWRILLAAKGKRNILKNITSKLYNKSPIAEAGKNVAGRNLFFVRVDEAASHGDLPMAALMTKLIKKAGANYWKATIITSFPTK